MTTSVILLLVLTGVILVGAACLDRRRAREIQRDVTRYAPVTRHDRYRG
ncbi:MAG: hypothetical protein J2P22_20230 [Nocardioides sp.]|nr:hypothetical protein [Nocardioides sp.]